MPMNRRLYPPNWEAISRQKKQRANWHCEACHKPCLLPGEEWFDFILRCQWTVGEALAALEDEGEINPNKITRFVLTTAHPNHDPENPEAVLRAWCAPCHARYDLTQMSRKQFLKREREGQGNLFDLTPLAPAGHGKDPNRLQRPLRQEPC
jgi:hypothetical protein